MKHVSEMYAAWLSRGTAAVLCFGNSSRVLDNFVGAVRRAYETVAPVGDISMSSVFPSPSRPLLQP